ncbi:unnamed protein product [Clonostachys byssicola]|uniref:Aminoglycoside phosphotransferase domain-containing protein n=1 Tax=Clonostachys byssicola TaxID=160290 RepID=A0A9N9UG88_9HYPO|nr:unnamed protein product [Clonostachys byssicola]
MDSQLPTAWASYKGIPSALKKRVDSCFKRLDTTPALEEAKRIFGREFEPAPTFSAGRKWLCMQLLSKPKSGEENGLTVVLRVRIPPARGEILTEAFMRNDNAGFFREQINAKVMGEHMKSIRIPKIYHVSPWGSAPAEKAGYPFMLMEHMGGNKLRDILRRKEIESFSKLDTATQDHIMSQWAAMVVEMSMLKSNLIGPAAADDSVSDASGTCLGNPTMIYDSTDCGLFTHPSLYFAFNLKERIEKLNKAREDQPESQPTDVTAEFLGVMVFGDILLEHFKGKDETQLAEFPLVHRTLTDKNILMDDEFNFVALVDLKDAVFLPEELQESYVWDWWIKNDSNTKYHSMLLRAEENERKKGRVLHSPLSKVTDNKLKTAFKLYNNLGVNLSNDPDIVMKLLGLVRKPDKYEPMHYLAGCVTRHWSSCYGISVDCANHSETGRVAFEDVIRIMYPEADDGRYTDLANKGYRHSLKQIFLSSIRWAKLASL